MNICACREEEEEEDMVEPVGRVTTLASNLLSGINEVSHPPPQRSDSIEEDKAASKSPH